MDKVDKPHICNCGPATGACTNLHGLPYGSATWLCWLMAGKLTTVSAQADPNADGYTRNTLEAMVEGGNTTVTMAGYASRPHPTLCSYSVWYGDTIQAAFASCKAEVCRGLKLFPRSVADD